MDHLGKQVVSTENEDYLLAKVEGLLQVGTGLGYIVRPCICSWNGTFCQFTYLVL